jgi:hypothetical protein
VQKVVRKAGAPALAVGAAAAGVAGGIALKSRIQRPKVLGVKLPRSLGKALPDLDVKSMAKSVGKASKQLGETSKSVSKDIELVGEQAERIGKILD